MTNITELALIAKIKKQLENFDTVILKEGEALALVEALEKAQQRIASQREYYEGVIADGGKRIDNLESFRTAYMEWGDKTDWMQTDKRFDAMKPWGKHRADVLKEYIENLESRTVKLSPELYTIGDLIRTQDNRITDQPMFVVFQKREIIGSDEHSPSRICWVWDGEEVSELRAKRLEALYQDGRDTRGYDRYAMQEVDEFVTACFTEHGCKDYLRQNGHNLRLPYIYACGSFRNNEYQLVRNWLAGIKVEAE
ncbi:ead/Ea22-like family protein [Klebsiella variicola]|uniref:ead/Ea22-like family protein n=1 Tax=Klebsiella variicola TaxID=244366 RepID=UPI002B0564D5|nr:ead/Ea22-like family protein [Klebsiella variicola]